MIDTTQVIKLLISNILKIEIDDISLDVPLKDIIQNELLKITIIEELQKEFNSYEESNNILEYSVKEFSNNISNYNSPGPIISNLINIMLKNKMNNMVTRNDIYEYCKKLNYEDYEIYNLFLKLLLNVKDTNFDTILSIHEFIKKNLNSNHFLENSYNFLDDELGEEYINGIKPCFDDKNIKIIENYWNYSREYLVKLQGKDSIPLHQCILNRSDINLYYMAIYLGKITPIISSHSNRIKMAINEPAKYYYFNKSYAPDIKIDSLGEITYNEVIRNGYNDYKEYFEKIQDSIKIRIKDIDDSKFSEEVTNIYKKTILSILKNGLSLKKNIILTASSKDSISLELLKALLMSGSKIALITTSDNYSFYRNIYKEFGGKNSILYFIKANLCSTTDLKKVIKYIYNLFDGIIDCVIPLANIYQEEDLSSLDAKNELALRLMAIQVFKIIGEIKKIYQENKIYNIFTQIILPLTPNKCFFGNDGFYSEAKLSLHSLLYKYYSEKLYKNFIITCVDIGWIRSRLMQQNNIIANEIEKEGLYTFNTSEMALYIIATLKKDMISENIKKPIIIDLTGNLSSFNGIIGLINTIRNNLNKKILNLKYLNKFKDNKINSQEKDCERNYDISYIYKSRFPNLKSSTRKRLEYCKNLPLDLSVIPVFVGFSDTGPYGNTHTRWDFECNGTLSIESCLELGWYMGILEYNNQKFYWQNKKTKKKISIDELYTIYEPFILENWGIKKKDSIDNYKNIYNSITFKEDQNYFQINESDIKNLKNKYNNFIKIKKEEDKYYCKFLKGAKIFYLRAINQENIIDKQIPIDGGINNLGIDNEFLKICDKNTQYTIVTLIEALLNSGINDPYDFYKYIHISELALTIPCNKNLLNNINLDNNYKNFNNKTISEWINILLLGSAGPVKVPINNFNSSGISLEMGCDLILQGKSKVAIVGGSNNSNVAVQILTTAELAIEMGLPIYGICAHTNVSSDISFDKSGTSTISSSKEIENSNENYENLLDYNYRISEYNSIISMNNFEPDFLKYIKRYWGHLYYKNNSNISDLKGALSVWGMNVDDISQLLICCHKYNQNLSNLVEKQMEHLKRNIGNPLAMSYDINNFFGNTINSALMSLNNKIIIGNEYMVYSKQNKCDNYIYYPDKNFSQNIIKSILLKCISENNCFELLIISPDYLLSHLDNDKYNDYILKVKNSNNKNCNNYQKIILGEDKMINFKENHIIENYHIYKLYLDPLIRAEKKNGSWFFSNSNYKKNDNEKKKIMKNTKKKIEENILDTIQSNQLKKNKGFGIVIQSLYDINIDDSFIIKNFTKKESEYCNLYRDSKLKLIGILSAKQALIQALMSIDKNLFKINYSLLDIEISKDSSNIPIVNFKQNLKKIIDKLDFFSYKISISNCDEYTLAVVIIF